MKLLSILFFILLFNFSYSQNIDFKTEKEIIKQTLSQYLDTNPNSIASFFKGGKGYKFASFGLETGIAMEEDSLKREDLKKDLNHLNYYSDSISDVLKTKKINVFISDTLFAYKYIPATNNLKNENDWKQNYQYLLSDFKYNELARMDTIIGEEYIDLIKRQVHYKGENKTFARGELDHSYYKYEKEDLTSKDEFSIRGSKIYRLVLNKNNTKGCFLFSFYCNQNKICRSFIFIKKENNKWVYVDEYPSWIVDES
ncbi:hypothetical protein [Flavobacterium sp. LHD-85]|uniref:hypothetical protein n=1 Tax=Flavobacterium sp. LHD-85 TaxID=3071410 RepID=UPI0027E125BF|nr:hypothetical protein [Flavobacterium sp. LHD-85]MDQ6531811.1 hypothetical protein [Flavobacterium sp. LHD-85]